MADKDSKIEDIKDDLTPDQAKELFATQFDEPIRHMLSALSLVGFTTEDFDDLLNAMRELMEGTVNIPHGLTVEEAMPYVYVSDLLTLGALSAEAYARRDIIEKVHDDKWGTSPKNPRGVDHKNGR